MTNIVRLREDHKQAFAADGARLTFTPFFVRAVLGAPASLRNLGAGLLAYVLSLPLLFALLLTVAVLAHRAGLENPAQGVGLLVAAALDTGPWGVAVVVAFAAYIYVERKVDEASPEAPSPPPAAPLPPGAVRRLPDGRLLYDDGSVRRA